MSTAGGPRLLLRRLREIMAEQTSAQMRLDKLVAVIASNMVAEVCSIYLRRAGKMLELFATEGLNRTAVHTTRMREGEGLVGLVCETAEAVNLSDAPSDPHFSYRPETGEDPYKTFLGVPIVRGGQVFGVLTVQNKAERIYAEEEVEALQTVAMVLAEVVAQNGFFNIAELDEPELRVDRPRKFFGDGLSEGVAVGHVVLHEPRVRVDRMIADNPLDELKRLEEAIASLRESVDQMLVSSELDLTGEGREVIEAYRLFAYDQGWRQRMRDAVRTGLTAEAAVERVQDETRLRVQRLGDPLLRERAHDLDDLARRLLRHLTGDGHARRKPAARRHSGGPQHGSGRTAGLWAREAGGPGAGGGGGDLPCRHRGAVHGPAAGLRARGHRRQRAGGRRHCGGWRDRRGASAPARRDRGGLCGEAQPAASGPGPLCGHPRHACGHQGRRRHQADDECRAGARHAASEGVGRGRDRPVPHRTAIHAGRDHAQAAGPVRLLQIDPGRGRRQAGDLPYPGSGRRQGPALCALGAGGKSGAGLARHPDRARSSGACCAIRSARC